MPAHGWWEYCRRLIFLKAKQTPGEHVADIRDLMISLRVDGADAVKLHSRTHCLSATPSVFNRGLMDPISLTPPLGHVEASLFSRHPRLTAACRTALRLIGQRTRTSAQGDARILPEACVEGQMVLPMPLLSFPCSSALGVDQAPLASPTIHIWEPVWKLCNKNRKGTEVCIAVLR